MGTRRSVGPICAAALAVLALLGAAAGATSVVAAERSPGVARLAWLEGDVSTLRAGAGEWASGEINDVLVAGDRLADGPGSRVEIETAQGLHLWLGAASDLEIIGLDDAAAQFRLTQGTLVVARRGGTARAAAGVSGSVPPLEILVPAGTLTLSPDAVVRLDVSAGGATIAQARAGRVVADVAGRRAPLDAPGSWRLEGQGSLARIARVDDPPDDEMDVWAAARHERFADVASAAYVNSDIEGIADLDDAGVWDENPEYGWIWRPTVVSVGWAPYAVGRWAWREPWGWTWIDDARWGWAPFHYGRWVRSSGAWWWAPGPLVAAAPVWAPALVGFTWATPGVTVSVGVGTPWIGWVPLGWGEPCLPWWSTGSVAIGTPWWGGWYGPQVVNNIVIAPGWRHHGQGHHGHGNHGQHGGHGDGGSPGGRPHPGGPHGPEDGGQTADRSPLPGDGGGDPGSRRGDNRLPQRLRWAHEQAGAVGGAPVDQLDRGAFRRAVLRTDSSSPDLVRAPINPRNQARVETARLPLRARGVSPNMASYEARRLSLGDLQRSPLRAAGREPDGSAGGPPRRLLTGSAPSTARSREVSPSLAPSAQPATRGAGAMPDTGRRAIAGQMQPSREAVALSPDLAAGRTSRRGVSIPPTQDSNRRSVTRSPWSSGDVAPSGGSDEVRQDSSPPPSSRSTATWSAPRSPADSRPTWSAPGSRESSGTTWSAPRSREGSGTTWSAPRSRAGSGTTWSAPRSRADSTATWSAPRSRGSSGTTWSAPRSRGSSGTTWSAPGSRGDSGSAGNEGSRWTGRSALGGRGSSSGGVLSAPAPRAPAQESVRSWRGGSVASPARGSWSSGRGHAAPQGRATVGSNDSGGRSSSAHTFGGGDRGASGRGFGSGYGAGGGYGAMRSAPSRGSPSAEAVQSFGGRAGIGSR